MRSSSTIATDVSDAALAARIRRGDQKAFAQVFRRYYEPLCRYSRGYTASMAAAEDVVQGLFSRLWERRAHWNPRSIQNYLYAAVRNSSLNAAERARRHVVFDRSVVPLSVNGSADSSIQQEELRSQVQHALTLLSSRQREVFYLSRNADLSHEEIAGVLGLSVHTVATHMARALQKLQEQVEKYQAERHLQP